MVDDNKVLKGLKIIKIVGIVVIVALICIVTFTIVIKKINTDNFYNYLEKENYKLGKYNIYTLETKNNNTTTTYQALANGYILSKSTVTINDDGTLTRLTLNYKKNKTIDMEYVYEGLNNDNEFGILTQNGTYKNGKLTKCKVVTGNNFDTKCPEMRENAKKYLIEINKILKDNNINPNYVKNSSK